MNYYNEFDPKAAAWLRALIADNLIPKGEVDERSITDVRPSDLRGFIQCHWFAGTGAWSLALRLAGFPETREAWTGSCPCQPFSCAGSGRGEKDERHLWPALFSLIEACRPEVVFGEQVASADVLGNDLEAAFADAVQRGDCARANKLAHELARSSSLHFNHRWLDGIQDDLEGASYTFGATDIPAASITAPHIRQRLYWVADAKGNQPHRGQRNGNEARGSGPANGCVESGLADANEHSRQPGISRVNQPPGEGYLREDIRGLASPEERGHRTDGSAPGPIGHDEQREQGCGLGQPNGSRPQPGSEAAAPAGHRDTTQSAGFWHDSQWHLCRDGKLRRIPTQPLFQRLADGIPVGMDSLRAETGFPLCKKGEVENRTAILKGFGNAIVPRLAAEFIGAYLDTELDTRS